MLRMDGRRMTDTDQGSGSRSGAATVWLPQQCAKHALTAIVLVLVGDVGLIALYVSGMRWPVFGEDRALEMATAWVFLAAFAIGLLLLRQPMARRYPALLPVAAGLGLLGFLDEISFGARYFGWSMPEM